MPTSAVEIHVPNAESVTITEDALTVELSDGRTLSVPLAWFPRLLHATPEERDNWRFVGKGQGMHWEDIDEDISIENLLARQTIRRKPNISEEVASKPYTSIK